MNDNERHPQTVNNKSRIALKFSHKFLLCCNDLFLGLLFVILETVSACG